MVPFCLATSRARSTSLRRREAAERIPVRSIPDADRMAAARLPPLPWANTAANAAWSIPIPSAKENVSRAMESWAVKTKLLMSLATWPLPRGPRWTTGLPNVSSTGRQISTAADSPPAMTRSDRLAAARPPPLTGASMTATPRSAARAATLWQVSGCTVEWIATMPPGDMPASTPSGPNSTSSTSASPTTQIPTTSLVAPREAGVSATAASVSL